MARLSLWMLSRTKVSYTIRWCTSLTEVLCLLPYGLVYKQLFCRFGNQLTFADYLLLVDKNSSQSHPDLAPCLCVQYKCTGLLSSLQHCTLGVLFKDPGVPKSPLMRHKLGQTEQLSIQISCLLSADC